MKSIRLIRIAAVALLTIVSASSSYGQSIDTLVNVGPSSKLVITENPDGTAIIVKDVEGGENEDVFLTVEYPPESSVKSTQSQKRVIVDALLNPSKYRRHGEWDATVDGICLGLNKATGVDSEIAPEWSKSFEISWLSCLSVGYFYKNSAVTVGLGFDWRNYKITTSDYRFAATPEKGIELVPYQAGENPRYSRLKIFTLQVPVLYRLNIPKTSLSLKLGPILDFNTYGSVKTLYAPAEGKSIEDFNKNIKPRRFTLDFFGSISLNKIVGIYIRYSPMKVMDAPGSFNFRPLTLGIGIGI